MSENKNFNDANSILDAASDYAASDDSYEAEVERNSQEDYVESSYNNASANIEETQEITPQGSTIMQQVEEPEEVEATEETEEENEDSLPSQEDIKAHGLEDTEDISDDETSYAMKVIQALDTMRAIDTQQRNMALQILGADLKKDTTDAALVVKIINVNPRLADVIDNLQKVYNKEPVEQAFFLMRLDKEVTINIDRLVSSLLKKESSTKKVTHSIDLSEKLVSLLSELDYQHMEYIEAASRLINATRINR